MKIKIIACFVIFLFLFSLAWVLDLKTHRQFQVYESNLPENPMSLVPLGTNSNQESPIRTKLYQPFKSREYVRISGHE